MIFQKRRLIEVPKYLLNAPLTQSLTAPEALNICALYMSDNRLKNFDWQLYHSRFLIRSIWPFIATGWNNATSLLLLYSHFDDHHHFPFEKMKTVKPISLMMCHSLLFCIANSKEMAFTIKEKKSHVKAALNLLVTCGIPLTDSTIRLAFEALCRQMKFTTRTPNHFEVICAIEDVVTIQKRMGILDTQAIQIAKLKVLGSNHLFNEMFTHFHLMTVKDELSLIYLFHYASMSKSSAIEAVDNYLPLVYKMDKPSRDILYQCFKLIREADAIDQVASLLEIYTANHVLTPRVYDLLIRLLLVQYGRTNDVGSLFQEMQKEKINFSCTTYYHLMTYYSSVECDLDEMYNLINMIKNRPPQMMEQRNPEPLYSRTKSTLQQHFSVLSFLDFLTLRRDFPDLSDDLVQYIPSNYRHFVPPKPYLAHPSTVDYNASNAIYDSNIAGNSVRKAYNWDLASDESLMITTDHFLNDNTPPTRFSKSSLLLSPTDSNISITVQFDGRMCLKMIESLLNAHDLNGAIYYWSRLSNGILKSLGSYYKTKNDALHSEYQPLQRLGYKQSKSSKSSQMDKLVKKYSPFIASIEKRPGTAFYPRPTGLNYPLPGHLYLPSDLAKATVKIVDFIQQQTVLSDYPMPEFNKNDLFELDFYKTDHGHVINKWMGAPLYSPMLYSDLDSYLKRKTPFEFSEIPKREEYEELPKIEDPKVLTVMARRLFLDTVSIVVDTFIEPNILRKFTWFKDMQIRLGLHELELSSSTVNNQVEEIEAFNDFERMPLQGASSESFYEQIKTREWGVFDNGPPDIDEEAFNQNKSF